MCSFLRRLTIEVEKEEPRSVMPLNILVRRFLVSFYVTYLTTVCLAIELQRVPLKTLLFFEVMNLKSNLMG